VIRCCDGMYGLYIYDRNEGKAIALRFEKLSMKRQDRCIDWLCTNDIQTKATISTCSSGK